MMALKNTWISVSAFLLLVVTLGNAQTIDSQKYVVNTASSERFPLASNENVASIVVDQDDFPGVVRVAGHLQNDLQKVTGI